MFLHYIMLKPSGRMNDHLNTLTCENFFWKKSYYELSQKYNELQQTAVSPESNIIALLQTKNGELTKIIMEKNKEIAQLQQKS